MMRAVLQRAFDAAELDRWFETVAQRQYTGRLLFSSLIELVTQVVLCQSRSMQTAWLEAEGDVGVSLATVYAKPNELEATISAALVSFAAERASEVLNEWPAAELQVLPSQRVRVLDGNCLDSRQHRLQVTRHSTAASLPGETLMVFDLQCQTKEAMLPCEDGHAQERALLN